MQPGRSLTASLSHEVATATLVVRQESPEVVSYACFQGGNATWKEGGHAMSFITTRMHSWTVVQDWWNTVALYSLIIQLYYSIKTRKLSFTKFRQWYPLSESVSCGTGPANFSVSSITWWSWWLVGRFSVSVFVERLHFPDRDQVHWVHLWLILTQSVLSNLSISWFPSFQEEPTRFHRFILAELWGKMGKHPSVQKFIRAVQSDKDCKTLRLDHILDYSQGHFLVRLIRWVTWKLRMCRFKAPLCV